MKHTLWCGQGLWGNNDYLPETLSFTAAINGKTYNEAENINVEMRPEVFIEIYKRLSALPEGNAARLNKEAKDLLLPQLMTFAQSPDVDLAASAVYILDALEEWDAKQVSDTDATVKGLISKLFVAE